MLSNQEIEKKLLKKYIEENDLQEKSKILEIKHWCRSYGELLEDDIDERFDFIAGVFKEEDSLKDIQSSGGDQPVKLDRRFEILKKLLSNDKNNLLSSEERYKVACWGCLEENIKDIFEEEILKEKYGIDIKNKVDDVKLFYGHVVGWFSSPLASFWTHYSYKDHSLIKKLMENKFSENGHSKYKDLSKKYKDLGEEKYYAIGFEYAAKEGKDDAMKFFINKISKADVRKKMLIDTATAQHSNVVAINFCLNQPNIANHEDFLMASYDEKFKHYSRILNNLVSKHSFEEALDLLKSWGSIVSKKIEENKPEQLTEEFKMVKNYLYNDYSSFIYGILDEMTMPEHAASFEEKDNFVYEMLSDPNLKIYKDLFIIDVSKKQFTPCRDKMATLLSKGNESKAVFHILESASKEQRESITSSTEFSLLPYFLSDLEPALRKRLKNHGVTEPDYNKSTESLEQSMSSYKGESEAGSLAASLSSEKLSCSPNIDLTKKEFD